MPFETALSRFWSSLSESEEMRPSYLAQILVVKIWIPMSTPTNLAKESLKQKLRDYDTMLLP